MRSIVRVVLPALALLLLAAAGSPASAADYAYGSPAFTRLVSDSYQEGGDGPDRFYQWMDAAYRKCSTRYPGKESLSIEQLLEWKCRQLAAVTEPVQHRKQEMMLAGWLHRMVKEAIPRFSLDRGYEFRSVAEYGERQCLLQSVLIAGMLQAMGVDAGMVMVYKNAGGQETNNGHVVALVKLWGGRDVMVDASEAHAFPQHRGLFARAGGYRYVAPVFEAGSPLIASYGRVAGGTPIAIGGMRPMDYAFVRSQFYYYRGERVKDGLWPTGQTKAGLERAARYWRRSVALCPENPLAVYMLARVYRTQGKAKLARRRFEEARALYKRFGWVPVRAFDIATTVQ